jgi:Putative zinc-finger
MIIEASTSNAGPCSEWELVLHAFFDGELDTAGSLACEQHLGHCRGCFVEVEKLKSMRRIFTRSAIGWTAPIALRNRIEWLSISGRHSPEVFAEDVLAACSLFKWTS